MLAPPLPTIDNDKKLEPLNLSLDGGSFTRAAQPLGSRWLRFDSGPNEHVPKERGYFFIRLFAMSPPKPNSVPITIMLGSGTAGGADEDRLATRKPR